MSRTFRIAVTFAAMVLVTVLTFTRAQTSPTQKAEGAKAPATSDAASRPAGAAFGASEKEVEDAAAKELVSAAPSSKPVVSPEAVATMDKLKDAYAKLTSLSLAAKVTGDFDVDGQKEKDTAEFTATYGAPNKFRHEIAEDGYVGSDGEKLYAYTKSRNLYMTVDAPKQKVMLADMPDPFATLLASQDLSLVLAISPDPVAEITRVYPIVDKAADVTIDNKPHAALKLSSNKKGGSVMTLALDPATNLIRRASVDMKPELLARGAARVDNAKVTVDYHAIKANGEAKPEQFAFAAPAGAKDATQMAAAGGMDRSPAEVLVGKPAPAFKLPTLDGKQVSLADQKGKVVVLDFWATWCPPCVEGLPEIDKLAAEHKPNDLRVFAVNQAEEKPQVQEFIKTKSLTLPVLLDADGKVGEDYHADPIPLAVIIGKDGVVRKVFMGIGPNTHKEIKEAVAEALKAQ
jgi:peroxiredoxin/outer membrane lipoprotein-sorting protein